MVRLLPAGRQRWLLPDLIGGITLLSQGIIGEYIGKIYMESKGRPRYIVDSMILRDAEDSAEEEQENERKD